MTTTPDAAPGGRRSTRADIAYRPAAEADLDACTVIWKTAIDHYQGRLGQPPMPSDLAPLRRLLVHTLATDPSRFWVAEAREVPAGSPAPSLVVGFASATLRDGLWFLAMLFVRPDLQGEGLGATLMDLAQAGARAVPVPGPDDPLDSGIHTWGMSTDAAQPISNGLYARRGMLPRVPIWRLFGEVRRALPELPASLEAVPFEAVAGSGPDGHRRLADAVGGLDRQLIGAEHPVDHAYLRREGRSGFLVQERGRPDASPLGYVYGSGGGRLGPLAAADPALHPALLGVAVRRTPMLGAMAIWMPGTADRGTRALLDAGLRYDGFPGLVCWSRPDHPFERYAPISLALV